MDTYDLVVLCYTLHMMMTLTTNLVLVTSQVGYKNDFFRWSFQKMQKYILSYPRDMRMYTEP